MAAHHFRGAGMTRVCLFLIFIFLSVHSADAKRRHMYSRLSGAYAMQVIPMPRARSAYIGTTIDDQLFRLGVRNNTFAERWP